MSLQILIESLTNISSNAKYWKKSYISKIFLSYIYSHTIVYNYALNVYSITSVIIFDGV